MDDYFKATLVIVIITLIAGVVLYLRRKADSNGKDVISGETPASIASKTLATERAQGGAITIPIERLPATTQIEEKCLFEITDPIVIARISETIPTTIDIASRMLINTALKNTNAAADLAIKNANKVFQKGEIYRAVIPSGATLSKSTKMEDAVRGLYHGAKGIKGHANLVKVDAPKLVRVGPTKISKATTVANGAANVMNIASLVVGQYYMSEINAKIETLSKSVSKISDFQEREFKGRILSLIALAGEISNFSSEIMESDALRNRKLQTLDDLKREGTQLLQQVNLAIDETIKKNQKPDYKEYQDKVNDFTLLLEYQQILMTIIEEICKLTYLLGKGESSNELSYSVFIAYLKQSNQLRTALVEWHQKQVLSLCIDIDKNRRSKTGLESIFSAIPALIDNKWHYKELEDGVGRKIYTQKEKNKLTLGDPEDIYSKDVQIIIKDGKYYYLTESLSM